MGDVVPQQNLRSTVLRWWRETRAEKGARPAASLLLARFWEFLRDSTPERRRQRYGDMEYDWDKRVNTTMGTVGWRARLLGLFHSPYMPTDPEQFRDMMAALPIDVRELTFIDIGSGKGRTLLMASEYPFRRIVGVELIAELHRAAVENIRAYHSGTQRCRQIEAVCADARSFALPNEPLLLYLFNPLPESGLRLLIAEVKRSLAAAPRPVYVLYHNPLLEHVVRESGLARLGGTDRFSLYGIPSDR